MILVIVNEVTSTSSIAFKINSVFSHDGTNDEINIQLGGTVDAGNASLL